MIYFLEASKLDLIKIGFTDGDDAADRIASLQTGSAVPLVLLATMPGDLATERAIHLAFADLREQGEWFRAEPKLRRVIAGVQAANGTPKIDHDVCWWWARPDDPEYILAPVAEAAYRRGTQQAAFFAQQLVARCRDLDTAKAVTAALQTEFRNARFGGQPDRDLGRRIANRVAARFSSRLLPERR